MPFLRMCGKSLAVGEQNAALTAQVGELEALKVRLEHFVKELNKIIYGKRSEKLGLVNGNWHLRI
jgi:hypothetical protein